MDNDKTREEAGSAARGSEVRAAGTIVRAVRVLDLIVAEGPLRFAELEEMSGLPKATLHRLLNDLADERLVRFDERASSWVAGYRILEMANRIWTRSDIRVLSRDQLIALNALSGETVQVSVLADTHTVVIDHVESRRSIRHSTGIGSRAPLYCTGAGKVLLAWCDERQRRDILGRTSFARRTPNTITERGALERELAAVSKRGYAIDDEGELRRHLLHRGARGRRLGAGDRRHLDHRAHLPHHPRGARRLARAAGRRRRRGQPSARPAHRHSARPFPLSGGHAADDPTKTIRRTRGTTRPPQQPEEQ